MRDTKQEHIKDVTQELAYLVEKSGRDLDRYHKGSITEEGLLKTAKKALRKYEELTYENIEGVDYLENRDFANEIKEDLEEAGYDNLDELVGRRNHATVLNEKSARSTVNSPIDEDLEIEGAFQVIEGFNYLINDIENRYNIETPILNLARAVKEPLTS